MKKQKFSLWFSKSSAQKGKKYYIPLNQKGDITMCTGLTLDEQPPTESSIFITQAYLPIE